MTDGLPADTAGEWRSYGRFVGGVAFRALSVVVALVSSIVTARGLGVEGRGLLYTCTAAAAIGSQLLGLGMPSAVILVVAARPGLARRGVFTAVGVAAGSGMVFAAGVWSLLLVLPAGWIPREVAGLVPLVAGLVSTQVLLAWCSSLTQGLGAIEQLPVIELSYRVVATAWAAFALFVLRIPFRGFLASLVAVDLLCGVAWLVHIRVVGPASAGGDSWPREWKLWSLRAYLPLLLNTAARRVDILVLSSFAGLRASGLYSVAAQAMDLSQLAPVFVGQKAMWSFAAGRGDNRVVRRLRRLLPLVVLAAMVAGALTADIWSPRLFGRDFVGVGPVLFALALGAAALAWETMGVQEVAAAGFPLRLSAAWLISFVVEIPLMLLLAPRYGAVGAGAALSATYIVLAVLVFRVRARLRVERRQG